MSGSAANWSSMSVASGSPAYVVHPHRASTNGARARYGVHPSRGNENGDGVRDPGNGLGAVAQFVAQSCSAAGQVDVLPESWSEGPGRCWCGGRRSGASGARGLTGRVYRRTLRCSIRLPVRQARGRRSPIRAAGYHQRFTPRHRRPSAPVPAATSAVGTTLSARSPCRPALTARRGGLIAVEVALVGGQVGAGLAEDQAGDPEHLRMAARQR